MPIRLLITAFALISLVGCTPQANTPELSAPAPVADPADKVTEIADLDVATSGSAVGEMCAGFIGAVCNKGLYCNMPVGDCAHISDAAGVCAERPEFCTHQYEPVCGCDVETYSNTCEANAGGVSVASTGVCLDRS